MTKRRKRRLPGRIKDWEDLLKGQADRFNSTVIMAPNGNGMRNQAYHRPGSQKK